jgi:hypothetical protein
MRKGPVGELVDREHESLWVESNHDKESARALEMLHVQLISAVIDPYSWKWALLATYHVLQAFLLYESDTRHRDAARTVRDSDREIRWLRMRLAKSSELDSTRRPLEALYEDMKRATEFAAAPDVDRDVLDVCAVRVYFIETVPAEWQLQVRELPVAVRNCLTVVDFLGWNPGHIGWGKTHFSDLARVKFLAAQKVLGSLERHYRQL